MKSVLCLFVKDEVEDLPEWIVHHASLGFDRIVIYDNKSNDGAFELANKLSAELPLEVVSWADDEKPVKPLSKQGAAYTDCLKRYRDEAEWLCFLDADEFLIPPTPEATIDELLSRADLGDAFAINWVIFGSAGVEDSRGRLVMEAFDRRSRIDFNPNRHVKMFFRPKVARAIRNPHFVETTTPCRDLNGELTCWSEPGITEAPGIVAGPWRLHHYFVRSRAHWRRRLLRRQPGGAARALSMFEEYDRNDVVDLRALPFARRAQERLKAMGFDRLPAPALDDPAEAPDPNSGKLRGFSPILCIVDAVRDGFITGWATMPQRPDYLVTLRIEFNEGRYELFDCHMSRKDVLKSDVGAEFVGFRVALPADRPHRFSLRDMNNRVVRFRFNGALKDALSLELG